jgi:hypothetical protein
MTMLHETPTLTAIAPQVLLGNHLKALKLPTFAREYEKVAMESAQDRADYPRYLLRLCELERIDRERRNVERRIRLARFPQTKSLDTFDFTAQPSLNKALVLELARCEWIEKRQNCIALGPSGTGKTHVALALGLAACQKGYSVAFTFDKDGAQQALFPYNDPGQLPITPLTSLSPPRLRMVNGTRTVRPPPCLPGRALMPLSAPPATRSRASPSIP